MRGHRRDRNAHGVHTPRLQAAPILDIRSDPSPDRRSCAGNRSINRISARHYKILRHRTAIRDGRQQCGDVSHGSKVASSHLNEVVEPSLAAAAVDGCQTCVGFGQLADRSDMHSVGCCRVALPKGCVGLHHLVADASHVAFVGGELLVYTLRVKLDVEQKRPDLVRATADGLDHRFFRLPSLLFALSCSVPLLLFELSRSFSPLLREGRGLLCIIDLPGNAAGNDDADGDAKETWDGCSANQDRRTSAGDGCNVTALTRAGPLGMGEMVGTSPVRSTRIVSSSVPAHDVSAGDELVK